MSVAESVRDTIDTVADTVKNTVDSLTDAVRDTTENVGMMARDAYQAGTEAMQETIEKAKNEGIRVAITDAIEKLEGLKDDFLEAAQDVQQDLLESIQDRVWEELVDYLNSLEVEVEVRAEGYAKVYVKTKLYEQELEIDVCEGLTYNFQFLDWTRLNLVYSVDTGLIEFKVEIHDQLITDSWIGLKFGIPATPIPKMMRKQCEEEDNGGEEEYVCLDGKKMPGGKLPDKIAGSSFIVVTSGTTHMPDSYSYAEQINTWSPVSAYYHDDAHYWYQKGWKIVYSQTKQSDSGSSSYQKAGTVTYNNYNKNVYTRSQMEREVKGILDSNAKIIGVKLGTGKTYLARNPHVFSLEWLRKNKGDIKCDKGESEQPQEKILDISMQDEECCSMIREILDRLGGDDFEAILPKALTDDNDSTVKVETIPEMLAKSIEYQDELAGSYPIKIKIEDTDLTKEGNQSLELEFPNQAELLTECYGLLYELLKNLTVTQELAYKAMLIAGLNRKALIKATAKVETIQDFLDFNVEEEEKKYPWLFTPGGEQWDDILEEKEEKIKTEEYDQDQRTLSEQLLELMQGAAIIRARYFEKVGKDNNFLEIIKQGASMAPDILAKMAENGDKPWKEWKDWIEDDLMDKYEQPDVKPDIEEKR